MPARLQHTYWRGLPYSQCQAIPPAMQTQPPNLYTAMSVWKVNCTLVSFLISLILFVFVCLSFSGWAVPVRCPSTWIWKSAVIYLQQDNQHAPLFPVSEDGEWHTHLPYKYKCFVYDRTHFALYCMHNVWPHKHFLLKYSCYLVYSVVWSMLNKFP